MHQFRFNFYIRNPKKKTNMSKVVYIVSAVRTPMGSFMGGL